MISLMCSRTASFSGDGAARADEAISLEVRCSSQAEVDHYWEKLGEGGDPKAQVCGWLKDKYGVSWQVVPTRLVELIEDPDAEKAGRAMGAMLQMKKLDVGELERAFAGQDR